MERRKWRGIRIWGKNKRVFNFQLLYKPSVAVNSESSSAKLFPVRLRSGFEYSDSLDPISKGDDSFSSFSVAPGLNIDKNVGNQLNLFCSLYRRDSSYLTI